MESRSKGDSFSTRRRFLAVGAWALVGTVLAISLALAHADASGIGSAALIQPGIEGDAASLIESDFPDLDLPPGRGHDGQYFYAVSQDPTDLDAITRTLDRPRYRLQRPLYPALSWAIHPTGGGDGLIVAMSVVGGLSLLLLGSAAGGLSIHLGGPPWIGMVAPLLPGAVWSFRLGLADNLALGLALLYLLLAERGHARGALLASMSAVLAREAAFVIILGHAVIRRDRTSVVAAAASASAIGAWWLALRTLIDEREPGGSEIGPPFEGLFANADYWTSGDGVAAGATVLTALVVAVFGIVRRGRTHLLSGPLVASTAFTLFLGMDVLGLMHNGSRAVNGTLALGILVLATPAAFPDGPGPWFRRHDSPVA